MQVTTFDQFEFECWEQEDFLAIASESKSLRNADLRVKNIVQFFKATQKYDCFSQWQTDGIDHASLTELSEEVECVEDVVAICKRLAGLDVQRSQKVYIAHSEWNLLDIAWESENTYYRVMWCMTA